MDTLSIKFSKCREFGHYDSQCPSKSQYIDNVQIDDIDNSRFIEEDHIPSEINSDVVDELVKSTTSTLDETRVHESISDVQVALVESSTLI